MPKLVVRCFAISLDGFSAAPGQSEKEPFGKDGLKIMNWFFPTKYFRTMTGQPGGEEGLDNDMANKADKNIGASIMGRHMFGPPADVKDKDAWKGWWGPNPPYHHPVFVMTHEKKAPLEMEGGTSFMFVNDSLESVLKQAFAAANGKDVRLAGGATTVRQFMKAGLIDELHLVQVPVFLGAGERIFEDLGSVASLYECVESVSSKAATHLRVVKKAPAA
jgi:dihydrofolate reductase